LASNNLIFYYHLKLKFNLRQLISFLELDKMMENVPQLTEDQKLIVEALKAQQEKVRISKRLNPKANSGGPL